MTFPAAYGCSLSLSPLSVEINFQRILFACCVFWGDLGRKKRKMEKFHSSSKMERKTIEKIRRTKMKELYSTLNSLISTDHSRVCITPSPLMRMQSHLGVLLWFISNIEYMRISNRFRLERERESTCCMTDLHFGCFGYEDRNTKTLRTL